MDYSRGKSVFIKTFGCQMNEHDTAKMLLILGSMGYSPAESMEDADVVILNTCTIREKAHHKAISEIGRAAALKDAGGDLIVGVSGCVAQEEGAGLVERYPQVDFVLGPDQISRLPDIMRAAERGEREFALELVDDREGYRFIDRVPPEGAAPSSAFVLAMKGCNCSCSYCIVPNVRGREISRPADDIVSEVDLLHRAGAREVTLLGQNVSAYRDLEAGCEFGLARLIRRISEETAIERIRFTSPHPLFVKEGLIEEFAENEKLCPHIHLPAQAGSNDVLSRMRRGYTRELYIERAKALRSVREGMSITTDLIVGFCGETERDFELTLDMMEEVRFDSAFAFKYSPRPGTRAALEMEDDVPGEEKTRRLAGLLDLQRSIGRRGNESLIGHVSPVLAQGMDRMGRGLISGRRADNRIVHFPGNPSIIGHIVPVRVTVANDNSLNGELADV